MQRKIRYRGVELWLGKDDGRVTEVVGRAVPQVPLPDHRRKRGAATTTLAVERDGMPARNIQSGVEVKALEFPLADLLLIVEDLILRAGALAQSGAPTEWIEAILDHVAALREGSE